MTWSVEESDKNVHKPIPQVSPDLCSLIEGVAPHFRLGWNPNLETFIAIELRRIREHEEVDSIIGVITPYNWPIYGSKFDRTSYVPINVRNVNNKHVSNWNVVSLFYVWSRPWKQREIKKRQQRGVAYEDAVSELTEEVGDHLFYNANRTGAGSGVIIANKHMTEYDRSVLRGEERRDLRNAFMGTPGTGAPLR